MPFFTTSDGLKLSYTDEGNGQVILCLPGLTRNQSDFDEFLAANRLNARIVCLTSRGRAPSDFDSNWQNYNVLQEAADAIALLDHLNVTKAMILGTSRGGILGMVLAQMHEPRVAGLVLNDIGPEISKAGLARIGDYLGAPTHWTTLEEATEATKANLTDQFPNLSDVQWATLAARWNGYLGGKFSPTYDLNLKAAFDATNSDVDLWPLFDMISVKPMGVIWGENSDLLTGEIVSKMQIHNKNLYVAKIQDRGHVPFLDEPNSLKLIEKVFEKSFA